MKKLAKLVEIEEYLGCIENELENNQKIIAKTTQVYIEPKLNAMPYQEKLTKGMTVDYHSTQEDFTLMNTTSILTIHVSAITLPDGCRMKT